jgi:hypothetical protein
MLKSLSMYLSGHDVLLFHFRDSSEEDDQDPQVSVRNGKEKQRFEKGSSNNRHAEDAEAGYLLLDETDDVGRNRSDSDLSYSYQYEAHNENDGMETPKVTQKSIRKDDDSNKRQAEDVKRKRSDSDQDADDEHGALETPVVTQPPSRNGEE